MEEVVAHLAHMVHLNHVHVPTLVHMVVLNRVDGVTQVICHVVVYQVMIRKKTVP